MKELETYILEHGEALGEDILKVDAFLNHQIDPMFMMELAKDLKEHFKDQHINKIVTIETSGIAPVSYTHLKDFYDVQPFSSNLFENDNRVCVL